VLNFVSIDVNLAERELVEPILRCEHVQRIWRTAWAGTSDTRT
jgi:hypothetical protein